MAKALRDLTESELRRRIEKEREIQSALIDALIEAGRGNELNRETRRKSDPLSVKSNENQDRLRALLDEAHYRERYHGSLKRVIQRNPLFKRPVRKEVTLQEVREFQEEESESLCRHHDFAGAKRALKQRPKAYARARGLRIEDKDRTAERDNMLKRILSKKKANPYKDADERKADRLFDELEQLEQGLRSMETNAKAIFGLKYTDARKKAEARTRKRIATVRAKLLELGYEPEQRNPRSQNPLASESQKDMIRAQLKRLHIGARFSGASGIPVLVSVHRRFNSVDRWLDSLQSEEVHQVWGELADTPYSNSTSRIVNPGRFIQGAIKRPGALHRKLGVPEGADIPVSLIRRAIAHPEQFVRGVAAEKLLQKEARFALELESFHHRNPHSHTDHVHRTVILMNAAEGIKSEALHRAIMKARKLVSSEHAPTAEEAAIRSDEAEQALREAEAIVRQDIANESGLSARKMRTDFNFRNPGHSQSKSALYAEWHDKSGRTVIYTADRELAAALKPLSVSARGGRFTIAASVAAEARAILRRMGHYVPPAKALSGRRNPEAAVDRDSSKLYDQFHGRGPNRIGIFTVPTGIPASVSELGDLLKIKLSGSGRMLYQLTWEPSEGVKLAADPRSESLYIIGAKQRLPDNCLSELEREFGEAAHKNQFIIGTIKEITYRTKKGFDKFETIDYYHELGEETGEKPLLVYDRLNHRLLIVGGAYTVKPEGITN